MKRKRWLWPGSIRGQLLALLAVVLVPALLVQLMIYISWYRTRSQTEINADMESAKFMSSLFSNFVEDVARHELVLGLSLSKLEPYTPEEVRDLLQAYAQQCPHVTVFRYTNPQGEIVASGNAKDIGTNLADRQYFQEIVNGEDWVVSNLLTDRVTGDETFAVARGIRDSSGKLQKVVVATIDIAQLWPLFESLLLSKEEQHVLFDRAGNLVFVYPAPAQHVNKNWLQLDPFLITALAGKSTSGKIVSPIDGVECFAARVPIGKIGWVAGSSLPVSVILAPIVKNFIPTAAVGLAVVAVSLLVFLAMYRRISGNLLVLEQHLTAFGKGELSRRLKIPALKEMDTVAETLNRMADELQSARDAAEQANRILEQRVVERTAQLQVLNESLRQEVAEREKAQKILMEQSRLLEAFYKHTQTPLVFLDRNFNFIRVNEAYAKACQREVSQLTGLNHFELYPSKELEDQFRAVIETKQPYHVHARPFVFPDHPEWGVTYWDLTVDVIRDELGEVELLVFSLEDVTQQVRALEEAKLRQQQMVQTDKMAALGFLVSGVAHEINNPNHAIMANVASLLDVWQDATPILKTFYDDFGDFVLGGYDYSESREQFTLMFANILASSKRIEVIVNELRDFARYSPKEKMAPMDLNAVIKSATILMSNTIKKHTDHFSVECERSLPSVTGNFQRIEQVVINLIQNACQSLASRDNKISLVSSYAPESKSVVIEVLDEGKGIPEEDLRHLGDPFFTTKRTDGGMGLGLWVSYSIVHEHGGSLRFFSKQGEGTRAVLSLPANEDEVSQMGEGVVKITANE